MLLKQIGNISIELFAECDDYLDLSWDDDGSITRGLDSGLYQAFVAKMLVSYTCPHCGQSTVIGTDYLGGCIYESLDDFARGFSHKKELTCYARDMAYQAINDARRNARFNTPQSRGEV